MSWKSHGEKLGSGVVGCEYMEAFVGEEEEFG